MSFILVRVDDRLIHGQVVVGWASSLQPDRIILCHDEIAANQFEKELYESSFCDADIFINVYNTNQLLEYIDDDKFSKERCILLLENLQTVLNLLELKVPIHQLNIGGIHFQKNKKQLTNYIFLDDEDVQTLTRLASLGITIEGQDTPNAKKIDITKMINL